MLSSSSCVFRTDDEVVKNLHAAVFAEIDGLIAAIFKPIVADLAGAAVKIYAVFKTMAKNVVAEKDLSAVNLRAILAE